MADETKIIKQQEGAMKMNLSGRNQITLNWKDLFVEVYHNGKRKFVIDLNEEGT